MSHTPFVGNWRTLGSLSKYMLFVVGQHDMYLHEDFRKRMVISLLNSLLGLDVRRRQKSGRHEMT